MDWRRWAAVLGCGALIGSAMACSKTKGRTDDGSDPRGGAETRKGVDAQDVADGAACAAGDEEKQEVGNHLVSPTDFLWPVGETLHVHFMDGERELIDLVAKEASEWSEHANIEFQWHKDPGSPPPVAHARVTFRCKGFYVRGLGTLSLDSVRRNAHSVCLGALGSHLDRGGDTAKHGIGAIKHEFGHLLGLAHEHQSPKKPFTWNRPYILDWCKRTQGWGADQCEGNILTPITKKQPYAKSNFLVTEFDPNSIMLYDFPAEFTNEGIATKGNYAISALDKSGIAKLYPRGEGRGFPRPAPPSPPPAWTSAGPAPTASGDSDLATKSEKIPGSPNAWAFAIALGREAVAKDAEQVMYFLPPKLFSEPVAIGDPQKAGHPWAGKATTDRAVSFKVRAIVRSKKGAISMVDSEVTLGEGVATRLSSPLGDMIRTVLQ
jgi:hypothetical protein